MKITTKSKYAVRAIYSLMALGGEHQPVSMDRILEQEDISKKYLERIFTIMKEGNVIVGTRGVGGGYMLARSADQITLREIINIADGPLAASDCSIVSDMCSNFDSCSVNWMWAGLTKVCDDYLEKITVKDLMSRSIVNNI